MQNNYAFNSIPLTCPLQLHPCRWEPEGLLWGTIPSSLPKVLCWGSYSLSSPSVQVTLDSRTPGGKDEQLPQLWIFGEEETAVPREQVFGFFWIMDIAEEDN